MAIPTAYDTFAAIRSARAAKERSKPKWLSRPMFLALLALPVFIFFQVSSENLAGVLIAYVNLIIMGFAAVYFVRQQSLEALIPVLFLAWQAFSWPLGSIYLACAYPEAYYQTVKESHRYFLEGNLRIQLTVLLWLILFLPLPMLLLRRTPGALDRDPDPKSARATSTVALGLSTVAIVLAIMNRLMALPEPMPYVSNGVFNYLNGILFVVGALFVQIPVAMRILTLALMFGSLVFFSLGNARGLAAIPLTMFLCGLLLQARLKQKWKTGLVIGALCLFPIFLVVADTFRRFTGGVGGFENIERNAELIGSRWQESLERQPVLLGAMTRMFSTGGHSIITLTPESYDYLGFDPARFLTELVTRVFVPGQLYFDAFYSTPKQLVRYDFRISESTSVELSMIGAFWLIGGPIPVALGALAMGGLHAALGLWFRKMRLRTPNKALFVFALLSSQFIWAQNLDGISYFAGVFRNTLAALLLYYIFVYPFVRENKSRWVLPHGDGRDRQRTLGGRFTSQSAAPNAPPVATDGLHSAPTDLPPASTSSSG